MATIAERMAQVAREAVERAPVDVPVGIYKKSYCPPSRSSELLELVCSADPEMEWHEDEFKKDRVAPNGKSGIVLGALISPDINGVDRRKVTVYWNGTVSWLNMDTVALP